MTLKALLNNSSLNQGSPFFTGRENEKTYIKKYLPQKSILITGPSYSGKSSFLNHAPSFFDQDKYIPICFDAGRNSDDFIENLKKANQHIPPSSKNIEDVCKWAEKEGKTLLLMIDEVDEIICQYPHFSASWARLQEKYTVRFLITGRNCLIDIGKEENPLSKLVIGPHFGGRALYLGPLEEKDAKDLVEKIDKALDIRWKNPEDREKTNRLWLKHSQFQPTHIVTLGKKLKELKEKNHELSFNIVDAHWNKHIKQVSSKNHWILHKSLTKLEDSDFPLSKSNFKIVLGCLKRRKIERITINSNSINLPEQLVGLKKFDLTKILRMAALLDLLHPKKEEIESYSASSTLNHWDDDNLRKP